MAQPTKIIHLDSPLAGKQVRVLYAEPSEDEIIRLNKLRDDVAYKLQEAVDAAVADAIVTLESEFEGLPQKRKNEFYNAATRLNEYRTEASDNMYFAISEYVEDFIRDVRDTLDEQKEEE